MKVEQEALFTSWPRSALTRDTNWIPFAAKVVRGHEAEIMLVQVHFTFTLQQPPSPMTLKLLSLNYFRTNFAVLRHTAGSNKKNLLEIVDSAQYAGLFRVSIEYPSGNNVFNKKHCTEPLNIKIWQHCTIKQTLCTMRQRWAWSLCIS